MILPPPPPHPDHHAMTWTKAEHEAIQAYGQACIKEYKASVSKRQSHRKFDNRDVDNIRDLHKLGWNYKQVNKLVPMSEVTFINIIKHRGAYK